MATPQTVFTVFDFYTEDFSTLDAALTVNVGYQVKARDIWSIQITSHEDRRLHVNLVIIYWKLK
jgi:hypothetical protein